MAWEKEEEEEEVELRMRVRKEFASAQSKSPTAWSMGVADVRVRAGWVTMRQERLEERRSWRTKEGRGKRC